MRKKALITGASRGIGAATARALGQAGYDLFLVCKSSEKELHIIKEEIEKDKLKELDANTLTKIGVSIIKEDKLSIEPNMAEIAALIS